MLGPLFELNFTLFKNQNRFGIFFPTTTHLIFFTVKNYLQCCSLTAVFFFYKVKKIKHVVRRMFYLTNVVISC